MRLHEFCVGPEVVKIRWAVDENIRKATPISQNHQESPENTVMWTNINGILNAISSRLRDGLPSKRTIQKWKDGRFVSPAFIAATHDTVHFIYGKDVVLAAKEIGATTIPVIIHRDEVQNLKEILGGGTVSSKEPLKERGSNE